MSVAWPQKTVKGLGPPGNPKSAGPYAGSGQRRPRVPQVAWVGSCKTPMRGPWSHRRLQSTGGNARQRPAMIRPLSAIRGITVAVDMLETFRLSRTRGSESTWRLPARCLTARATDPCLLHRCPHIPSRTHRPADRFRLHAAIGINSRHQEEPRRGVEKPPRTSWP